MNAENEFFNVAVNEIHTGNIFRLNKILITHPRLVNIRAETPDTGYFKNPYLLWYIADNPIRIPKLPSNIVDIAFLLVNTVKQNANDKMQFQLNYTLELVATGSIPRECGVQIELMDLLMNEGQLAKRLLELLHMVMLRLAGIS